MLKSFRLKNFKAIQDSQTVKFTPLTAFIGNNGSGKSSLIEGLAAYRTMIFNDQDNAMNPWYAFNNIRNQSVPHILKNSDGERPYETNPIEFHLEVDEYETTMTLTRGSDTNEIFIQEETLKLDSNVIAKRNAKGEYYLQWESHVSDSSNKWDGESMLRGLFIIPGLSFFGEKFLEDHQPLDIIIDDWQFLNLYPHLMGLPLTIQRPSIRLLLKNDGSNLAEYLRLIYEEDEAAFNGIIETLKYVLPYAQNIHPKLTSEQKDNLYIEFTEGEFTIPGLLLSTGTLRILALLAILRNPNPAPLIVIEEIENGLDPRSINLIVDEIRNVVESGKTQVIITTHSPYLLDLLDLSQIVLVERDNLGQPVFSRPGNQESLQQWSKKFGPGKLYTMNRLSQRE